MLVIPSTAVLSAPYGDSVYVIEQKAATRTAQARGWWCASSSSGRARPGRLCERGIGAQGRDRVVGSGLFKLRNGMAVMENNDIAPKADRGSQPADRCQRKGA